MAGARLEIEFDDALTLATLRRATDVLGAAGLKPLLGELGEYLLGSTREREKLEVSPEGMPWDPLAPAYARQKARKRPGAPMLVYDFHMLGDQLSWQIDGSTLLVGTNAKYGAIQQFGGDTHHAARSQRAYFKQNRRTGAVGNRFVKASRSNFAQWVTLPAYTVTLPARPWLGVSREDADEIHARTLAYIRDALDSG